MLPLQSGCLGSGHVCQNRLGILGNAAMGLRTAYTIIGFRGHPTALTACSVHVLCVCCSFRGRCGVI